MNTEADRMVERAEWRPVVGYEGLYSVSSDGRVMSHARIANGKKRAFRMKERILRPGRGIKCPYLSLHLTDAAGVKRSWYVHHLVLAAFVGKRPSGMEACHNDGNRGNNCSTNLRWDTRAHNHADKRLHGTSRQGERHPFSVLTESAVLDMRSLRQSTGASFSSIAKKFNVSTMTAYRAVTAQTWAHI